MPKYGDLPSGVGAVGQSATALAVGESLALFNAEVVAATEASIAVCRAMSETGADGGITFMLAWAAAPTATVIFQGANADVPADYQTLYTSTNKQLDNYTDTTRWAFYRVLVSAFSLGGALTVIAQR